MTKCALCAIARHEEAYLAEWAAFHLLIGFDRVFIYDNNIVETPLTMLEHAEIGGRISVKRWCSQDGLPPQVPAYDDFLAHSAPDYDWVMFLDIDEFLNLKAHDTVGAFVDGFGHVDAIAVNWRIFGSAGQQAFVDDLVLRRFDLASLPAFPPNALVKTIFRPSAVAGAAIHSPHFRPNAVMVNPGGRHLETSANAPQPEIDYTIAQVNHYFTKSAEEFIQKRKRGRGDLEDGNAEKYRSEETFRVYDVNETKDTSIQRFLPALDKLLGPPTTSSA